MLVKSFIVQAPVVIFPNFFTIILSFLSCEIDQPNYYDYDRLTREPLLKGNVLYSRPVCTSWFRLAAFDIVNNIYFFRSYLSEEPVVWNKSSLVLKIILQYT
jgi:hypothetical protein